MLGNSEKREIEKSGRKKWPNKIGNNSNSLLSLDRVAITVNVVSQGDSTYAALRTQSVWLELSPARIFLSETKEQLTLTR
jgi:hypothetical protein